MSSAADDRGVVLGEMLVVMLITSLLVAALLSTHAQLQGQLMHVRAHQLAHERARLASLVITQELKRAGFWGMPAVAEGNSVPLAVSAAHGEIRCQRQPCVSSLGDALAGGTQGSEALIVRYARAAHELAGTELPFAAVDDARQEWRFYATGLYLSGKPSGLYQRIAGRRNAEELVRGICELKCRYAELDPQGRVTPWRSAAAIQQWPAVVAVQCRVTATGSECAGSQATVQRQFEVALRNPLERWRAQRAWQQLARQSLGVSP
ncbi:hypothetical protein R84981_001629 [Carnimonas sp. R-84981]|uniref:PilW family protein n=1 Tax=Carnimonas bestiolae TaxID=3402172 RepID=UPI003EDB9C45